MPVPISVLRAWGLTTSAEPLDGGQGTSVRVGDLVLKPYADEVLVGWLAGLASRMHAEGFVLPAPVPARDGRLVVDGWSATEHVPGAPVDDDDTSAASWLPVLDAGRLLHAALEREPAPAFLLARTDRWAAADRAAWGDAASVAGPGSRPLRDRAFALVREEGLSPQLVHGDLSGNVLVAEGRPPAVIDLSPYWRPAAYADAVVVVDALLWWRTDPTLLELGRPADLSDEQWRSLLARALVFRLLAFDEPNRSEADVTEQLPRCTALLEEITARA